MNSIHSAQIVDGSLVLLDESGETQVVYTPEQKDISGIESINVDSVNNELILNYVDANRPSSRVNLNTILSKYKIPAYIKDAAIISDELIIEKSNGTKVIFANPNNFLRSIRLNPITKVIEVEDKQGNIENIDISSLIPESFIEKIQVNNNVMTSTDNEGNVVNFILPEDSKIISNITLDAVSKNLNIITHDNTITQLRLPFVSEDEKLVKTIRLSDNKLVITDSHGAVTNIPLNNIKIDEVENAEWVKDISLVGNNLTLTFKDNSVEQIDLGDIKINDLDTTRFKWVKDIKFEDNKYLVLKSNDIDTADIKLDLGDLVLRSNDFIKTINYDKAINSLVLTSNYGTVTNVSLENSGLFDNLDATTLSGVSLEELQSELTYFFKNITPIKDGGGEVSGLIEIARFPSANHVEFRKLQGQTGIIVDYSDDQEFVIVKIDPKVVKTNQRPVIDSFSFYNDKVGNNFNNPVLSTSTILFNRDTDLNPVDNLLYVNYYDLDNMNVLNSIDEVFGGTFENSDILNEHLNPEVTLSYSFYDMTDPFSPKLITESELSSVYGIELLTKTDNKFLIKDLGNNYRHFKVTVTATDMYGAISEIKSVNFSYLERKFDFLTSLVVENSSISLITNESL